MRIPNFIDTTFVSDDGKLTDTWRNILSQLFTELQKNTSVEGLVMPSQTDANIVSLGPNVANGSMLYNSDTKKPMVDVEGVFLPIQTGSEFAFNNTATGLTWTVGTSTLSLTPGYVIPTTTEETNWNSSYSKRVDTWTAPLQFSSNIASIPQSSTITNGYLSSSDWNIFNGKEPAITAGTTAQYWRGDKSWQTLNATAVGLGNVTNDAQTKAAIVPNTLPIGGQILVGNAVGTAYAPKTMSTDISLDANAVATITNNAVTNAKLAQAGANTYKGNNTGVLANVSDIATNTAFNQSFETLTANIKPNGTVSVGALSTIARANHIHAFSATQPLVYSAATGNISLGSRSIFISAETNGIYNNYRTRNLGAAGNFSFNFSIPSDFYSLVACYVQGFVSAGAAGANKNIDISVEYNSGNGQLYNQFTASDTATLYNLTGLTNRLYNLPITSLLTSLVADSVGGINVKHTALGGSIDYIGLLLIYV